MAIDPPAGRKCFECAFKHVAAAWVCKIMIDYQCTRGGPLLKHEMTEQAFSIAAIAAQEYDNGWPTPDHLALVVGGLCFLEGNPFHLSPEAGEGYRSLRKKMWEEALSAEPIFPYIAAASSNVISNCSTEVQLPYAYIEGHLMHALTHLEEGSKERGLAMELVRAGPKTQTKSYTEIFDLFWAKILEQKGTSDGKEEDGRSS